MRILELGKFYAPHRGGIETLVQTWSEAFVRQGASVDCVVASETGAASEETMGGVRLHRCASWGSAQSVSISPSYLGATRRFPSDLWHGHMPNPLMDAACFLGNRSTPLVLSYHSDVVRQNVSGWLYRPLLHWLLRRASCIVVATRAQIQHSPVLPRYQKKCEIIPFGVDLAKFAWNEARAMRVSKLLRDLQGLPAVLAVGRLVGYKGHRYLLEACRTVDTRLWIVGTGPLENELKALALSLGIGDRVTFWGRLEDEAVVDLMSACSVLALPSISRAEGFGLVQIEAMACGKPVLNTSLETGVPWVSQDGMTGLTVPPADAEALRRALIRLLGDREWRHGLGEAGRRRAKAEFDQDLMNQRYWSCFQRLAGKRSARP